MTGKIKKLMTTISILMLLAFPTQAYADDAIIYLNADKHMTIGVSSEVQLVLENLSGQANVTSYTGFDDFEIISTAQSSQATIVNGVRTTIVTVTYTVMPLKTGDFTLQIAVTVDGNEQLTDPITVTVDDQSESIANTKEETFIHTSISKDNAYFGEAISLNYDLYTSKDLDFYQFQEPVTAEGAIIETVMHSDYEYDLVDIDGIQYKRFHMVESLITPTKTGLIEVPPLEVYVSIYTGNLYNTSSAAFMNTEPITFNVDPLPEAGKPSGFTGLIGDFHIESHYDSDELSYKEPLSLNVSIEGSGNLALIDSIEAFAQLDAFTVYENTSGLESTIDRGGVYSAQTYELLLVAKSYEDTRIEAIKIPFFNTGTNTYDYLIIEAHDLRGDGTAVEVQEATVTNTPLVISQVTPIIDDDDTIQINLSKTVLLYATLSLLAIVIIVLLITLINKSPKRTPNTNYYKHEAIKASTPEATHEALKDYILTLYGVNIYTSAVSEMGPIINDDVKHDKLCKIIHCLEYDRYHNPVALPEIKKMISEL